MMSFALPANGTALRLCCGCVLVASLRSSCLVKGIFVQGSNLPQLHRSFGPVSVSVCLVWRVCSASVC